MYWLSPLTIVGQTETDPTMVAEEPTSLLVLGLLTLVLVIAFVGVVVLTRRRKGSGPPPTPKPPHLPDSWWNP